MSLWDCANSSPDSWALHGLHSCVQRSLVGAGLFGGQGSTVSSLDGYSTTVCLTM